MKTIAAGQFKDLCLQMLDDVEHNRTPVIITKRGRPVAKLVPVTPPGPRQSLAGSVIAEHGDPFTTGEAWHDGAP
jgi:antitoxin (DNA-binding transcriptional repressor) of toxin-antitoxin stability system